MKALLYDINWRGGLFLYTRDLATHIQKMGTSVSLLTSNAYPKGNYCYELCAKLRTFTARKHLSSLHWMADRTYTAVYNAIVRSGELRRTAYDILHLQTFIAPIDQYFFKSLHKKLPLIFTVHDTLPHYDKFVQRRSFIRNSYKHIDQFIVHYQGGVKNLVNEYNIEAAKISVIPHGLTLLDSFVDQATARNTLKLPPDATILLFFGSIRPDKGLGTLLHAMAEIKKDLDHVRLVIAGSVPRDMSWDPYVQLIERLELQNHVITNIRFIEEQEISTFFSAADICVLPYDQFDSQSGVLMQAYVHYKPILATNVGAVGETIKNDNTGVVVEPRNVGSLATGLKKIIADRKIYAEHCTRDAIAKYSWENVAKMTVDLYSSVLQHRGEH